MKPLLSVRNFGFLILLVYVVLSTVWGRFSVTDEVFFKSAGREWALHGKFAAPELANSDWYPAGYQPSGAPETAFFAFPPVYPFGFGLLVKFVGFGWRSCVFYDASQEPRSKRNNGS